MKKLYRERLLKLARMLVADAKNKKGLVFDLTRVGEPRSKLGSWKPALDCGTTACAMGLAALSGKFSRAGLSYEIFADTCLSCTLYGQYQSYTEAAEFIFGLTHDEAFELFNPNFYPKNKRKGADAELFVAQRIRDLVKQKTPKKRKVKK